MATSVDGEMLEKRLYQCDGDAVNGDCRYQCDGDDDEWRLLLLREVPAREQREILRR